MTDIVERLRVRRNPMLDGEREEAAGEIKRLRHEVKLREQICADATLYARRLQEADAEIERLRGLLRESLRIDAGDFSVNVDEWIKRVREELGE